MVIATLCYLRENTKTLMIHRNKRKDDYHYGKWNGLGGKLKNSESPEEAVRREIKEESGLEVKELFLKGVITFPLFDKLNDWLVFVFTAEGYSGELIDSEEGELKWVNNNDLLGLNLWPGDRIFLPWLEKNSFFSAKFIYQNAMFLDYQVNFYVSVHSN